MSLESQLQNWHALWQQKKKLDMLIPQQEERLKELKDRISASGILSNIIQQTVNMDMPRGSDNGDKIGNLVSSVLDKSKELEAKIELNRVELFSVEMRLDDIQVELSQFSDRHQIVLTAYYRDHIPWQEICRVVHIEKSRLYDMINETLHDVELFRAVE